MFFRGLIFVNSLSIFTIEQAIKAVCVNVWIAVQLPYSAYPPHYGIKTQFSNPPNERIWSMSIISSLKIGMRKKSASEGTKNPP